MDTQGFFCEELHGVQDTEYGIPLCERCRDMGRFQILLIRGLCFVTGVLNSIEQSLRRVAGVPTPDDLDVPDDFC